MIGLRRRMRRPLWALLVVCIAGLTTACHTYTPVSAAPPGSTVRVQIPVRSALDDPNAPPRTEAVEGQVVENGDTIVLAIRNRMPYGAFREIVQHDTLRLGPDQRYQVEVREFSAGRSVALGVGLTALVVGAAIVAYNAVTGTAGEGLPDDGPQPAVVRAPLGQILDFVLGR